MKSLNKLLTELQKIKQQNNEAYRHIIGFLDSLICAYNAFYSAIENKSKH